MLVPFLPMRDLASAATINNPLALRALLETRTGAASKPRSKFLARRVAAAFQNLLRIWGVFFRIV